jgi:hypothetical protein
MKQEPFKTPTYRISEEVSMKSNLLKDYHLGGGEVSTGTFPNPHPDPQSDPLVKGTDPRIRIRMLRTAFTCRMISLGMMPTMMVRPRLPQLNSAILFTDIFHT